MNIYERIKQVADEKGVSINKMEKDLGYARSSISKFQTSTPGIDKVMQIADYLGVSLDYLVNLESVNWTDEIHAVVHDIETQRFLVEASRLPSADVQYLYDTMRRMQAYKDAIRAKQNSHASK